MEDKNDKNLVKNLYITNANEDHVKSPHLLHRK
jgi:hypothetical protein